MNRRSERHPSRVPRGRARAGAPAKSPVVAKSPLDLAHYDLPLSLVAIALFAIALAWVAIGPHRLGDYATETDFYGAYADGARALQHGRLDPARYGVVGPVYELALAAVGFVVRDLFSAAEAISVIATIATLLAWLWLWRHLTSPRLALVGTLFLVTNAQLFRYGYTASTDALALALQALALAAMAAVSRRDWALAGVVAALAILTRYSAGYLFVVGLAFAWSRERARAAIPFALGVLVPLGAWVGFSLSHGVMPATSLHHNVAYEIYAHARGLSWDDYQRTLQPTFHSLREVLTRDPGAVRQRLLFNLFEHVRSDAAHLLGWPVAIAALVGLGLALRDGLVRRAWPLWLAGLLLYLSLVPVFYSERYALPLLPIYVTLAAAAFASPWLVARLGRWASPALLALALVPVGLSAQSSLRFQRKILADQPVEIAETAKVLRQLARPGDRVIARKPHLAFHAGLTPVPFPFSDSLPVIAEQARRTHARWLYISWVEAMLRPRTQFLLDTTAAVPGLTPRATTRPHPSVLYEIGPGFGALPAWVSNDTLRTLHRARTWLVAYPNDVDALATAAFIEAEQGDLMRAREHAEHAAMVAPTNAEVQLLRGEIALKLGDGATAFTALESVTRLAPGSQSARVAASLLERMRGK
jgi:Dolichyl-phosphate-mannose-protein mannosyltransferase